MTLTATIQASINATSTAQSGLTTAVENHPLSFQVAAGDCSVVWSDRRICSATGVNDVLLASEAGVSVVKFLLIRNLSTTATIALTAGWNGTDFRNFIADTLSWNFAPMVNLGNLTLRGYPIRPLGSFMLSCPNSTGFATSTGGETLRIGGPARTEYEIYVMGN
jgi:hypothetical protein